MSERQREPRDSHDYFRMLSAAAVDGRLDPDSAAELEAHLATCASCRADHAAMLADHAWLAAPAAAILPRAEVRAFILEAARAARVPRVGTAPRPWSALAATALVVAVIGGGMILASRVPGAGTGSPTTPMATSSPSAPPSPGSVATPGAPLGTACRTIPAGLSARWTFDEPHERLSDTPLILVGVPPSGAGIQGSALSFRGAATDVRMTDTNIGQLSTEDFTVSVWVRFISVTGEQVLVERFREGPPELGWTLTKLKEGEIRLEVATQRDAFAVDSAGAGLTPAVWHHVAARRQGRSFTLFVDGRLAGAGELPGADRADASAQLPLLFGRRGDDRGFFLNGDLDEVLIWSGRGLSDSEVGDLYAAGSQGFCEAAAGAGYEGEYRATDCASRDLTVDCGRWGDSSVLHLMIGPGEAPVVQFEDASDAGCGEGGSAGPRTATGVGRFEGAHLWVSFTSVTCPAGGNSWSNPLQLYKSMNDTRLWFDPDGDEWGTIWERV